VCVCVGREGEGNNTAVFASHLPIRRRLIALTVVAGLVEKDRGFAPSKGWYGMRLGTAAGARLVSRQTDDTKQLSCKV